MAMVVFVAGASVARWPLGLVVRGVDLTGIVDLLCPGVMLLENAVRQEDGRD